MSNSIKTLKPEAMEEGDGVKVELFKATDTGSCHYLSFAYDRVCFIKS